MKPNVSLSRTTQKTGVNELDDLVSIHTRDFWGGNASKEALTAKLTIKGTHVKYSMKGYSFCAEAALLKSRFARLAGCFVRRA